MLNTSAITVSTPPSPLAANFFAAMQEEFAGVKLANIYAATLKLRHENRVIPFSKSARLSSILVPIIPELKQRRDDEFERSVQGQTLGKLKRFYENMNFNRAFNKAIGPELESALHRLAALGLGN